MKRFLVLSFLCIILISSDLFAFEMKLEDKYSFNYESNKIDYLNIFYFQDYLIFEDIYYIKNSKKNSIFNLNEKIYNYYSKYKISSEILTNSNKNELYYHFFSLLENESFYTVKISVDKENLSLIKEDVNYESIKNSLSKREWIKFPYHLLKDLVINYNYDKKLKIGKCEVLNKNNIVFNFEQSFFDNELIYPPKLNNHNTKITFVTKCKNQESDLIVKNGQNKYELLIFSIIYDATINDTNVRLRSEPNLNCETLTYLNEDDNIKIYDRSDEIFKINDEDWYWYQVKTNDGTTGWVYGKYLDIEK